MNDYIGKTVVGQQERNMAARDTYKDWVTWVETTLTFDDATTLTLGGSDTEVYDPFEYKLIDGAGTPIRADAKTSTCRRCERFIVYTEGDGWIDPEAGGDDSIWRETCDENHEDRIAAHEPKED